MNIEDEMIAKLNAAGVLFDDAVKWVHDHTGVDSATHIAQGLTDFDKLVSDLKGGVDSIADDVSVAAGQVKADLETLIADVSGGVISSQRILDVLRDTLTHLNK